MMGNDKQNAIGSKANVDGWKVNILALVLRSAAGF
jgi:hypothetical protein